MEREKRNYYTTEQSHVFVDPVITRHNDALPSTCAQTRKKDRAKSENRKQKMICIVVKALGLES